MTSGTARRPRITPVDPSSIAPFKNQPPADFGGREEREAFLQALKEVRAVLGREHPIVISGERISGGQLFESHNPAQPGEVIARFPAATGDQAALAVEAASKAFESWSRVPARERAAYLLEAARRMKERRHHFSALMVLEVGKSWPEADADTAEAIDFLEFYAREMLRLDGPQPVEHLPGERDQLVYIPVGPGVVIPPWNFPLAITTGMTAGALVAGNTVVLKPASDAPLTAWQFFRLMEETGLPPGVLNFVTGRGDVVGRALVDQPKTRFVSFTGSKAAGVEISERAAVVHPGQMWLKRVVAEMGGKGAIIVDSEADIESAVKGVAVSAFGFQGQKCSACTRAIVDKSVYDAFLARLCDETSKLRVGPPEDPSNSAGPVINRSQRDKVLRYIETGKAEGRLVAGGGLVEGLDGYFIQPTVFADVRPGAVIAQQEIFGPVLAVIRAEDFDDALRIANGTEYGLTGAVYTRSREKIERAAREFHVGNLYINRKCTGALVGVHPFGGFNMSGTDAKAGGRDYLLHFLQAKSIAEKV